MMEILIAVCIVIALIFSILGVAGLFRFPDFYTRMHAAGLVGSFGFLFTVIAVLLYSYLLYASGEGEWLNFAAHVLLAAVVVFITATTSTHAIARSAYRSGNTPENAVVDALKEEENP
jgi:multicomponent Na+:H+ antiporter subunit G